MEAEKIALKTRLSESYCPSGHPHTVSCICTHPTCNQRFICLGCILTEHEHFSSHRNYVMEVSLFVDSLIGSQKKIFDDYDQDKLQITSQHETLKSEISSRYKTIISSLSVDFDELQRKVDNEIQAAKNKLIQIFEADKENQIEEITMLETDLYKFKSCSDIQQEKLMLCNKLTDSLTSKAKLNPNIYDVFEEINAIENKCSSNNALIKNKWQCYFDKYNSIKAESFILTLSKYQKCMDDAFANLDRFLSELRCSSSKKKKDATPIEIPPPLKDITLNAVNNNLKSENNNKNVENLPKFGTAQNQQSMEEEHTMSLKLQHGSTQNHSFNASESKTNNPTTQMQIQNSQNIAVYANQAQSNSLHSIAQNNSNSQHLGPNKLPLFHFNQPNALQINYSQNSKNLSSLSSNNTGQNNLSQSTLNKNSLIQSITEQGTPCSNNSNQNNLGNIYSGQAQTPSNKALTSNMVQPATPTSSQLFSKIGKSIPYTLTRSYNNMVSTNYNIPNLMEGNNVYVFTGWNAHDFIRIDLGEEKYVERMTIRAPIYNNNNDKDIKRISGAVLQVLDKKNWINVVEMRIVDSRADYSYSIKRRARYFQLLHGEKMPISFSLGVGKLKFEQIKLKDQK